MTEAPREPLSQARVDALFAALVLVPDSFPRNRFFQLFRDERCSRVRRRAVRLRSLVGDLCSDGVHGVHLQTEDGDDPVLVYAMRPIGGRRRAVLEPGELLLLRCLVGKKRPERVGVIQALGGGVEEASARVRAMLHPLYEAV